jgi:hypothetical protein
MEHHKLDKKLEDEILSIANDINLRLKEVTGRKLAFVLIIADPIPGQVVADTANVSQDTVYKILKHSLKNYKDGTPKSSTNIID